LRETNKTQCRGGNRRNKQSSIFHSFSPSHTEMPIEGKRLPKRQKALLDLQEAALTKRGGTEATESQRNCWNVFSVPLSITY
jgi:hypothetical protein